MFSSNTAMAAGACSVMSRMTFHASTQEMDPSFRLLRRKVEQGAGAVNGRIERRPGGLAVVIAPSGRFPLHLKFGSRSPDSSAFTAGQVKRQVRPEDA